MSRHVIFTLNLNLTRTHTRTRTHLSHSISSFYLRPFTTGRSPRTSSPSGPSTSPPSPPRLPAREQREFERLQRTSTGAFSAGEETRTQSPHAVDANSQSAAVARGNGSDSTTTRAETLRAAGNVDVDAVHPDMRRGPRAEFEGERNPRTGEVGGPKSEPLRWGSDGTRGDWSYGGRVTDF